MKQGYTPEQSAEMLRVDAAKRQDYAAERKYETLRQQANATTVSTASGYHHWAKDTGIPQAANPFEYAGDLALYAEKGYPRKESEKFSPVDPTVLNLREGRGGQDYVWLPDSERNYDLRGAMDTIAQAKRSGTMGAYGQLGAPSSSKYGTLSLADQQDIARYVNENPTHQAMGFRTNDEIANQRTDEILNSWRGAYVSSVNPTVQSQAKKGYLTDQEMFAGAAPGKEVYRPSDITLAYANTWGGEKDQNPVNAALITATQFFTKGSTETTITGKTQVVDRSRLDPSGGGIANFKYIGADNRPIDVMKFKEGGEYVGADGKTYQDYRVSDLSKVTITPQKTIVKEAESGYERGERLFAEKYTQGGQKFEPIDTGSRLDYAENMLRGMYEGIREKPLTATVNVGVGLALTAVTLGVVNPAATRVAVSTAEAGGAKALAGRGVEWGVTKAAPVVLGTAYAVDVGSGLSNGKEATRQSVYEGSKRIGYETVPLVAGGLAYSPLKAGITGATDRVSTSYNNLKARGWENIKSDVTWKVESTARNVKSSAKDFRDYGFSKPKSLGEVQDQYSYVSRSDALRHHDPIPSTGIRSRGNPEMAVNRAKTETSMTRLKSRGSGRPTPSQQSRIQMNMDTGGTEGGMVRVYGQGDVKYAMPDPVALSAQRAATPPPAKPTIGGIGNTKSAVKTWDALAAAKEANKPQYYWGQQIGSTKSKTFTYAGKTMEGYSSKSQVKGKWAFEERIAKSREFDAKRSGTAGIEKTDLYKLGKGKGKNPLTSGGGGGVRSPVNQGESRGEYSSFSGGGGGQRIGSISRFEAPATLGDQMGLTARGRRMAMRQRAYEDEFLSGQSQRTPPDLRRPTAASRQETSMMSKQSLASAQKMGLIQESAQGLRLLPRTMQVSRSAQKQSMKVESIQNQRQAEVQKQAQTQRQGLALVSGLGLRQVQGQKQSQITTQDQRTILRTEQITTPVTRQTTIQTPRINTSSLPRPQPQRYTDIVTEKPRITVPGIVPFALPGIGYGSGQGSLKVRSGRKHTEQFSTAFGTLSANLFGSGGGFSEERAPRQKSVYGNYRGQFTTARGKTIRVKPMPKRMYDT
jgi:hypothetical protein